jgi:ketose-bisphosphate aldolase
MLVHIKNIAKEAKKSSYAVGAFNIHNIESVLGIARAAVRANSPVIIQVSESTIEYMGIKPITHLVSTVAKNIAISVPVALHLDHGKSLNSISECIKSGFSSVHIDASELPLDENIALTKSIVAFAHDRGVWVQGEVGSIIGEHGRISGKTKKEIPLADPEEVIKFVSETKVDTIAAAIGTAHGVFSNEDINFPLLRKIAAKVKIPFVLHGGSGIDDGRIKKAIKEGVVIINIGTDVKVAFSKTLINTCAKNKNETDPRKLLSPTIKAIEETVYNKIKLFGGLDKAGSPKYKT